MINFQFNTDYQDHSEEVLEALELWAMRVLTIWGSKIKDYAQALVPVGTEDSTGIEGYVGGALKESISDVTTVFFEQFARRLIFETQKASALAQRTDAFLEMRSIFISGQFPAPLQDPPCPD